MRFKDRKLKHKQRVNMSRKKTLDFPERRGSSN
jgi:hypothetical protein